MKHIARITILLVALTFTSGCASRAYMVVTKEDGTVYQYNDRILAVLGTDSNLKSEDRRAIITEMLQREANQGSNVKELLKTFHNGAIAAAVTAVIK